MFDINQCSAGKPGDGVSRRSFLKLGLAGLGGTGLAISDLLRLRAHAEATTGERTALLVVYTHGGASHLDTFDPKPDAPAEFRGPFRPIATRVPGLQLCELFPRLAAQADKLSVLRSLTHTGIDHRQGQHQLFTGHSVPDPPRKPLRPDCLAVTNYVRFDPRRPLPNYVGVHGMRYLGAAYLGLVYEPMELAPHMDSPTFAIPKFGLEDPALVRTIKERRDLCKHFDALRRDLDARRTMQDMDTFQDQAWSLTTSAAARRAFDLDLEDPRTHDRYGRTRWGRQCLMARRLIEAGVDLVTTTFYGVENGLIDSWDDHAVNCHCFDAMKQRAPYFDQAVSALIEDIYERGLDRRVLVVVTGEFGRTPRITYAKGVPGRDHWPNCCSMLFAGGGLRTGQVIGRTDRRGEQVIERRVSPHDFLATLYRHLGVAAERLQFTDTSGRPIPVLADGRPIAELCAG